MKTKFNLLIVLILFIAGCSKEPPKILNMDTPADTTNAMRANKIITDEGTFTGQEYFAKFCSDANAVHPNCVKANNVIIFVNKWRK